MKPLYASDAERFVREMNAMITPTLNSPMIVHRFGSRAAVSLEVSVWVKTFEFESGTMFSLKYALQVSCETRVSPIVEEKRRHSALAIPTSPLALSVTSDREP